jgi:hypothetical protein
MKKVSTWIIVALTSLLLFFFWKIVETNTNDDIPQVREYSDRMIKICDWPLVDSINPDDLPNRFPYKEYLDSCNTWNILSIKNDLACLDTLFENKNNNRRTLSIALTSKLSPRFDKYLQKYQPDSLLVLLQWAEKFKTYAEADQDNKIFYESIYNYWTDTISHILSRTGTKTSSIKYNFKFKYLQTRCIEQRVSPAIKKTSFEKAYENLIYNKWGHLINASWNQTSVIQKIVFLLAVVIFLIGLFYSAQIIIRFISKKNKHE